MLNHFKTINKKQKDDDKKSEAAVHLAVKKVPGAKRRLRTLLIGGGSRHGRKGCATSLSPRSEDRSAPKTTKEAPFLQKNTPIWRKNAHSQMTLRKLWKPSNHGTVMRKIVTQIADPEVNNRIGLPSLQKTRRNPTKQVAGWKKKKADGKIS